jgi:hypothetical protein
VKGAFALIVAVAICMGASPPAVAATTGERIVWCEKHPAVPPIAKRHGAVKLRGLTAYRVRGRKAKAMVRALRRAGVAILANEPNSGRSGANLSAPFDPLEPLAWWRPAIVAPELVPPPVTGESPLLVMIDGPVDLSHPEFAGSAVTSARRARVSDVHGTATAAIAGAPRNDVGIAGVWPGMRILNLPFPSGALTCADSVELIVEAIERGAAVISMPYGGPTRCMTEEAALQIAVAHQIVLVAAVGNDRQLGSPPLYPAAFPHVLTVGATGPSGAPAGFSSSSASLDLSAPGVDILTAVPLAYDDQAPRDGYMTMSGTSFPVPMVAAAAAWVLAARPSLTAHQVADALRASARDIGPKRGWDRRTGWGMLDIAAALAAPEPAHDLLEPNDDIFWVDGSVFGEADPSIGSGGRHADFRSSVARAEDPVDVYRVVVSAHGVGRVTVRSEAGTVALTGYRRSARTIEGRSRVSTLSRGRIRHLVLRNTRARPQTFYVAIASRTREAHYRFSLRR